MNYVERDLEKLDSIITKFGNIVAIQVEVFGMVAENQWRLGCNSGIAYAEDSFNDAHDRLEKIIRGE